MLLSTATSGPSPASCMRKHMLQQPAGTQGTRPVRPAAVVSFLTGSQPSDSMHASTQAMSISVVLVLQ